PELLLKMHDDCLVNNDLIKLKEVIQTLTQPIYDHAPLGVGIFYHPSVFKQGRQISGSVLDVAPTAMHMLGLPVPRGMKGQVLEQALESHYQHSKPVQYADLDIHRRVSEAQPIVNEKLVEKLRALGYIGTP
ncbi:hypothetical protein ACFL27_24510, partial [candidate division CSSED10-310 bacterium]